MRTVGNYLLLLLLFCCLTLVVIVRLLLLLLLLMVLLWLLLLLLLLGGLGWFEDECADYCTCFAWQEVNRGCWFRVWCKSATWRSGSENLRWFNAPVDGVGICVCQSELLARFLPNGLEPEVDWSQWWWKQWIMQLLLNCATSWLAWSLQKRTHAEHSQGCLDSFSLADWLTSWRSCGDNQIIYLRKVVEECWLHTRDKCWKKKKKKKW